MLRPRVLKDVTVSLDLHGFPRILEAFCKAKMVQAC